MHRNDSFIAYSPGGRRRSALLVYKLTDDLPCPLLSPLLLPHVLARVAHPYVERFTGRVAIHSFIHEVPQGTRVVKRVHECFLQRAEKGVKRGNRTHNQIITTRRFFGESIDGLPSQLNRWTYIVRQRKDYIRVQSPIIGGHIPIYQLLLKLARALAQKLPNHRQLCSNLPRW